MTESWDRWLRAAARDNPQRLGFEAKALARCTGQDYRALAAVAACWELYTVADTAGEQAVLQCVRELLSAMQPSCWMFARALIARSMDWRDRERLWPLVSPTGKCNTCGLEKQLVQRFGGFLLCAECHEWAKRATAAETHVVQGQNRLVDRCDWEGCNRPPLSWRGHFRFCEKHVAEIDERDPCVDCQAGNCGVHTEAKT